MENQVPAVQLRTNRAWWKVWLLTAPTLGIYPLVVYHHMSNEINQIATKYDNKKTMAYVLVWLLTAFTLGILALVWNHKFCKRVDAEMTRRGLAHDLTTKTFWGWGFWGTLLFGIGPLIFMHKLFTAFNALCADYNEKGE